jgi:hypothetical protein
MSRPCIDDGVGGGYCDRFCDRFCNGFHDRFYGRLCDCLYFIRHIQRPQ